MSHNHADASRSDHPTKAGTSVCAADLADLLLTDQASFQEFATWLDGELAQLEARFADFCTASSSRPGGRR